MASLLLPIIYLSFISLGLPDSLLGAAWPTMYKALDVPVSWAGILSMIIAAGTVISSLASDKLSRTFSTGKITAVSVCTTAFALFGFFLSRNFLMLCLFAIPYGLGAGSVDAVLNNYVASNYKSHHMNWLHCMWGIGCSIGPVIMGRAIALSTWNIGFLVISVFQVVLTLILFTSLPLWKKRDGVSSNEISTNNNSLSLASVIKIKGVKEVMVCFFCYCALESTAGMWAASYCTLFRGISAETAAIWASIFYIGITAGRFVCGFISMKLSDQKMIRLGQILSAIGILFVVVPFGNITLVAGLVLIGLGCAPIYPSIIHETPANFGKEYSQAIIGIQMASAYVGSCLVPPIVGYLAEHLSFALFPICLGIILFLMIVMAEALHKKTAQQRRAYNN